MANPLYEFEGFSNRQSFNKSLRHFKAVNNIVADFNDDYNMADVINDLLAEKAIRQNQVAPIVSALLVDKFNYVGKSCNMPDTFTELSQLCEDIQTWNAVDLVVTYHHPELGIVVINPKNPEHWNQIRDLKKNELVCVYVGAFSDTPDYLEDKKLSKLFDQAIDRIFSLIGGKKGKTPKSLTEGDFVYEPEEPEEDVVEETVSAAPDANPAPKKVVGTPAAQKRIVGPYSVPVTNELFHNGNVEAWKRIIESYKVKYPENEVYIFYDNERIHDINTLFKWGKVKHGSSILFSVAGEVIKDIARLQRYLKQGASNRFEDFLRFPVGKVPELF